MGVIALGLAAGLMAIGIAILLRTATRSIAVLAFLLATVPATALVVLTPRVIVELERLAA